MISRLLTLQPGDEAIVAVKIDICRKYRLPAVPKNSSILALPCQKSGKPSGRSCW